MNFNKSEKSLSNIHRLYIFTGKGGVGKTTLAKAFVRFLMSQNVDVAYVSLQNQALGDRHLGNLDRLVNGIREISLDLEDSARGYMEKRLNSRLVSSWIVKTPFFRALVNMMPGFSYLIFMGKMLQIGVDNPQLTLVLDAPASGHALTMVESTSNFQTIFQSGIIFEDTRKMLGLLNNPAYTKIHIVSLPSLMSWQEAQELKAGLKVRTPVDIDITVNNCLFPLLENSLEELPKGLKEKILNEKQLVENHKSEMRCILQHSLASDSTKIEMDLVGSLSNLI
jgi:anion-transporting  ArsA/GET3 family ATPase